MMLRPFFSYFGGKWTLAPKYPIPKYATIVEPFAGSAGYACRYFDHDVVLVERNPVVAALWRWLIKVPAAEIRSLPLILDAALCPEARTLIGFWLARGRTRPALSSNSSWLKSGKWPSSFWGEYARERVARQVEMIRHWRVVEGDYSLAPDIEATWFIDPPYIGSRHYLARVDDFLHLGEWCRLRQGQVIVCEQEGATWLPFQPFTKAKSISRGSYREVIWLQEKAV